MNMLPTLSNWWLRRNLEGKAVLGILLWRVWDISVLAVAFSARPRWRGFEPTCNAHFRKPSFLPMFHLFLNHILKTITFHFHLNEQRICRGLQAGRARGSLAPSWDLCKMSSAVLSQIWTSGGQYLTWSHQRADVIKGCFQCWPSALRPNRLRFSFYVLMQISNNTSFY